MTVKYCCPHCVDDGDASWPADPREPALRRVCRGDVELVRDSKGVLRWPGQLPCPKCGRTMYAHRRHPYPGVPGCRRDAERIRAGILDSPAMRMAVATYEERRRVSRVSDEQLLRRVQARAAKAEEVRMAWQRLQPSTAEAAAFQERPVIVGDRRFKLITATDEASSLADDRSELRLFETQERVKDLLLDLAHDDPDAYERMRSWLFGFLSGSCG